MTDSWASYIVNSVSQYVLLVISLHSMVFSLEIIYRQCILATDSDICSLRSQLMDQVRMTSFAQDSGLLFTMPYTIKEQYNIIPTIVYIHNLPIRLITAVTPQKTSTQKTQWVGLFKPWV